MRTYLLIAVTVFAFSLSACVETGGTANVQSVRPSRQEDAPIPERKVAEVKVNEFKCRPSPAKPPQTLKFKSYYKKSDQQRAEVNKKAHKKYRSQTESLRKFENELIMMSNGYLRSGRENDAIAQCALGWLHEWAAGDAYLGKSNTQGEFIRQWGLAVVSSAYGQIKSSPALDKQQEKEVEAWLLKVAQEVMKDYSGSATSSVRFQNNHLYWAAWAVTATALALDDAALYRWGVGKAKYAILTQIREDGTLPLEMGRGKKALHYHVFALTPLVLIAETAARSGEDLYELRDGILRKAAQRVFEGIKDPSTFAQQAETAQEPVSQMSSEHFAWLEVYNSRFHDPAIEAWLKNSGPVFSRRAGGDVKFLYRSVTWENQG